MYFHSCAMALIDTVQKTGKKEWGEGKGLDFHLSLAPFKLFFQTPHPVTSICTTLTAPGFIRQWKKIGHLASLNKIRVLFLKWKQEWYWVGN